MIFVIEKVCSDRLFVKLWSSSDTIEKPINIQKMISGPEFP